MMLLLWMLVEEELILVAPPRIKIVDDGAEKALARVVREKIAIRAR